MWELAKKCNGRLILIRNLLLLKYVFPLMKTVGLKTYNNFSQKLPVLVRFSSYRFEGFLLLGVVTITVPSSPWALSKTSEP